MSLLHVHMDRRSSLPALACYISVLIY